MIFAIFLLQEHLSKTGVENPAPRFPKYCPPGPSADRATDKQETRPTASSTLKRGGRRTKQALSSYAEYPDGDPLFSAQCTVRCAPETRSDMWAQSQATSIPFPPFERAAWCTWTHLKLSPGLSACEADVMPLHHVPLG